MKKTLLTTIVIAFLLTVSGIVHAQDTSRLKKAVTTATTKKAVPSNPAKATSGSTKTLNTPATKTAPAIRAKQPVTGTAVKPAVVPAGPVDNSLAGQYDDLLKHSWMQQGYQVVNPNRLRTFWKSVQDTLRIQRTQVSPLKAKINEQEKTIKELQAQVSAGVQDLEESKSTIDQVNFLGMRVDKSTYNTIMWGAVITLAAALLIVLFTAGRSIREAKYRRQLYDEISAEYQTYKVKANDKEKKLARELQTERNRVEELLDKNK